MSAAPADDVDDVDAIDLSDLDWWTRPLSEREAAFALLRAERPIAPMTLEALPHMGLPETPYWAVSRHADIVEASRHPELFCSGRGTNIADLPPDFVEFFGSMINMDDPRHARMRRIVSRGFTPRQLESMKADVESVAAGIVDEIIEQGECDFVTEVAARLPLRIIVDMMGIPRSEEEYIFDRTNVILGSATRNTSTISTTRSASPERSSRPVPSWRRWCRSWARPASATRATTWSRRS
jgi:cytochrome P450